jgi:hypothetical protein
MGELKIKINDETESVFRKLAMFRFGYQKGSLSEAAQEAISNWNESGETEKVPFDPIESISGLIKKNKKSSVQLQHEAWKGVEKKYVNRY